MAIMAMLLAGCTSVTPERVPVDRLEYGEVLAESWKRQTLLNVVRIRYGDAPIFLEVGSIINSYSVGGKAAAGAEFPSDAPDVFNLGAESVWSNTPTVTYQPLVGDRFTRSLLQPIAPSAILQLLQSGWSANRVIRIITTSINGLRNASTGSPAEPRFLELVDTLDELQAAGALEFRVRARKDGSAVVMVLSGNPAEGAGPLAACRQRLVELLGVSPDSSELEVVFGRRASGGNEIAILTRSMLELMLELGFYVELPPEHIADGSTLAGRGQHAGLPEDPPLRIHSGRTAPASSYTSVRYQDHWFWIDDKDIVSKSTFTFLLILFSLAETGQPSAAPVVTVPSR
jgi:hypothetical protein